MLVRDVIVTLQLTERFDNVAATEYMLAHWFDDAPSEYVLSTLGVTAVPKEPTEKFPDVIFEAGKLGIFDALRSPTFDGVGALDNTKPARPLILSVVSEFEGNETVPLAVRFEATTIFETVAPTV